MQKTITIPSDDVEKFSMKFSLGRDRGMGSRQFLRIKVPSGRLTSEHLRAIAGLSDRYGKGYAEITDRQDIQLHWIRGKDAPEIFAKLDELGFTTDKCGQSYPGPRFGDVRNVGVCPVTGINKNEIIDVSHIAKHINDLFHANADYMDMPRKFKISITGCELGCTRPEMQDLGLFAVERDGKVGFAALVGGALGPSLPGPRLGKPLGVFIEPDDVFEVVKAIVNVFKENGNRESKPKARFKWLVEEWGVERVREKVEHKLGMKLERFDHGYPEVSGEEHVGVQDQWDGKKFISVPVIGGVLSSEKMRAIADTSEEFGNGEIKITLYQNFVLPNVPEEKLGTALKRLKEMGLPVEGAPLRWTVVGCASDFCGKSVEPHPKQIAKKIVDSLEERFGEKLKDLKVIIHISGCMHDCGLHRIGQIGILGVKATDGEKTKQLYNFSVGGGLGAKNSFAQQMEQTVTPEKVVGMVENLVGACIMEGFKDFGEFCFAHPLNALKYIANGGSR